MIGPLCYKLYFLNYMIIILLFCGMQDLNCLSKRYLEPLKEERFLTSDEIDHIFGNIQEIAQFQRQFLQSLVEAIGTDDQFLQSTEFKDYRVGFLERLYLETKLWIEEYNCVLSLIIYKISFRIN